MDRLKSVVDALKLHLDSSTESVMSIFLSIQKKLEHLERERDELAEKLAQETNAKQVLHDSLTFQITSLETNVTKSLQDTNAERDKYEALILALREEKNNLQRKIDMLHVEQQNLIALHEKKEHDLRNQIHSLELEINNLRAIINKKDSQHDLEKETNLNLVNQLNTSITELKLKMDLADKNFAEQIRELTKQRDRLQKELEALRLSSSITEAELKMKITTIEEKNQKLVIELDETKKREADKTKQIGDLQTLSNNQQQEIELLKKKLFDAKEETTRLTITLTSVQSSLSMMLRETDYFATHRAHTRLTTSHSLLEKKHESILLEKYMLMTGGSKFLTLKEFAKLLLSMEILTSVVVPEVEVIFPNTSISCIGWIELLTAWKDIYCLAMLYDEIGGSTNLNRTQLGKVFTDCGLRFFDSEYKKSFDSIVRCVDKGGEELVDKMEFLKICVLLICLGMLFNYTDTSNDKRIAMEELLKVMNLFGCSAIYVKSVETQFHLYAAKDNKSVITFEGFVGILLANIE